MVEGIDLTITKTATITQLTGCEDVSLTCVHTEWGHVIIQWGHVIIQWGHVITVGSCDHTVGSCDHSGVM